MFLYEEFVRLWPPADISDFLSKAISCTHPIGRKLTCFRVNELRGCTKAHHKRCIIQIKYLESQMLKMRRTSPLFLVKWQPDIAAHSAIFFSAHLYIHAMQLQLFFFFFVKKADWIWSTHSGSFTTRRASNHGWASSHAEVNDLVHTN